MNQIKNLYPYKDKMGVIRCLLSTPKIVIGIVYQFFSHLYPCKDKNCKLLIDSISTMNEVSMSIVAKLNLKLEPHPHPFRVAQVDWNSLPVTKQWLVSIKFESYCDEIYCDFNPMDVAHILLGRPWLYDLNVTSSERDNTFTVCHNDRRLH